MGLKFMLTLLVLLALGDGIASLDANVATFQDAGNDVESSSDLLGLLEPIEEVLVSTVQVGCFVDVPVNAGDYVVVGQEMVVLDSGELEAEIAVQEAKVKGACTRVDLMDANLDFIGLKLEQLSLAFNANAASSLELETGRFESAVALRNVDIEKANRETSRRELDRLETLLANRTIKAPLEGHVIEVKAKVGESTKQYVWLVRVARCNQLLVRFGIPVERRHSITPDQSISIRVEGRRVNGKVHRIANEVGKASQTIDVEVIIDNSDRSLLPGTECYADFSKQPLTRMPHDRVARDELGGL